MNKIQYKILTIIFMTLFFMINIALAMEKPVSDAESLIPMVAVKQQMIKDRLAPFLETHIKISGHDTEKLISDMLPLISWREATESGPYSLSSASSFNGYFNSIYLQPGLGQNPINIETSGSIMQLKAKNPIEPDAFLYWLFNIETKEWQLFSKDCHVYSKDVFEQKIQALYPNCNCSIKDYNFEKGRVLTLITDPSVIRTQRVSVFSHRSGTVELETIELLTIKADIFNFKSNIIIYMATDSILHAKRIDLSQEGMQLEEILPPQPEKISSWDEFIIFNQFVIAGYNVPQSLERQYYRIQDDKWVLLHKGPYPQQLLKMSDNGLHLISYSENGITISNFNCLINSFEPTNVRDFPIKLISPMYNEIYEKIKFSKTGSVLALKDYEQGHYVWHFLESEVDGVESSSSAFATHEDRQREYNALTKKLSDKLEGYAAYAGRKFSIESLSMSEDGHITDLCFGFPEGHNSKRHFISMTAPFDESAFSHGSEFHPPLQEYCVSDHEIPYFYVSHEHEPNGKSIILMEGGPESQYDGSFSKIIKTFTQNGWAVIIPQESNRTGHGWKHYSKGFGEMGRENLHQLLSVFQDAVNKNLIADLTQMHLYGHSYGGFVAASFALRWDELHAKAGLEKKFNFQSIIADAAFINIGLQDKGIFRSAIIGTEDPAEFRQKYMPLHTIGASSSLSAPLTLIQGACDVRCSAEYMRQFSNALNTLNAKDCTHKLFWHAGAHSLEHERYPEFLLAHMNGAPTSDIEKDLFMLEDNI